jgi:FkbM family methyltransferase
MFGNTSICIKPIHTDTLVSGYIKTGWGWESEIVRSVMGAMERHQDATLLDIGCNIGMFTVVAAALGRQVVAVDADPKNLAYVRKSLDVGSTTKNVRLFNNGVSDQHMTLYPTLPDKTNEGTLQTLTKEELDKQGLKPTLPSLESVTLVDILTTITATTIILKMDIEGYECKALQPEVILGRTSKLSPYIYLEWNHIANPQFPGCPEYHQWKLLFAEGGYSPYHPGSLRPVKGGWLSSRWSNVDRAQDILWVHHTAVLPVQASHCPHQAMRASDSVNMVSTALGWLLSFRHSWG